MTGLSAAAKSIGTILCKESQFGWNEGYSTSFDDLLRISGFTPRNLEDTLEELSDAGLVLLSHTMNFGPEAIPTNDLFVLFDQTVYGWDTVKDAERLAQRAVQSGEEVVILRNLASELGWGERQANPAAAWLVNQDLLDSSSNYCVDDFYFEVLRVTSRTRRFVEGMSREPIKASSQSRDAEIGDG